MQIAYSFCLTAIGQPPSLANKDKIENYCENLIKIIEDNKKFQTVLTDAIANFNNAKDSFDNKFAIKDTEKFTNHLFNIILKSKRVSADLQEKLYGYIIRTGVDNKGFNFGFISRENNDNIFFHQNQNPSLDFDKIKNKQVTYTIEWFKDKEFAKNIIIQNS